MKSVLKQLRLYLMEERLEAERWMQRKLDSGICSAEYERGQMRAFNEVLSELDKLEEEARK